MALISSASTLLLHRTVSTAGTLAYGLSAPRCVHQQRLWWLASRGRKEDNAWQGRRGRQPSTPRASAAAAHLLRELQQQASASSLLQDRLSRPPPRRSQRCSSPLRLLLVASSVTATAAVAALLPLRRMPIPCRPPPPPAERCRLTALPTTHSLEPGHRQSQPVLQSRWEAQLLWLLQGLQLSGASL